ncbi:hypothetical protein ACFSM5_14480 [Lacibacterium aquatile]|uniref:Uncharacterized protein n=1 Tax=Lacibacterium aquatile TaxID=1168082 RepID=A0ABW5DUA6_9PROT
MGFRHLFGFLIGFVCSPAFAQGAFDDLGRLGAVFDDRAIMAMQTIYVGELNLSEEERSPIRAALKTNAAAIKNFLDNPANKDERGQNASNLLYAMVMLGFDEIVAVLLAYPEVKASLNGPTANGISLWATASLALPHSGAFCGNEALHDKINRFVGAYHGTKPDASPFPKIRRMLEAAGATPQVEEANAVWANSCTDYMTNEKLSAARDRIGKAADILPAILKEMERHGG